ncbi:MAG: GH3 auxin-responsive promoter family protein [Candidatus Bathyarchaeia archaeon]
MFQDENSLKMLKSIVDSWYSSLENPQETQRQLLLKLVEGYGKTLYGEKCGASEVEDEAGYRRNFPIINYEGLNPYLAEVEKGNFRALLPEPLVCWVMTRGSTGPAKVLPATETHLEHIFTCGARALVNHALRRGDFELLNGKVLNLNFPSRVHTLTVGGMASSYGYSSGTYARLKPALGTVSLVPRQEEIDALGVGITRLDWMNRFELVYRKALNERVYAAMGVAPVILSFAKYLKQKHGVKPKDVWSFRSLFCTSVRKIQFKYAPVLRKYYGQVPVVEIYSATEGVFAQQLDDLPYVSPNYDKYFFEVVTGRGVKMLHELKRGEWGRLIVSTCILPRYDIGDLVEAAGKNYFRVIGRRKFLTVLEHRLYRLFFKWFL